MERANSFFFSLSLSPGEGFEGLESETGNRTPPTRFTFSALLSLPSYVLGPDKIVLDVKSPSASDGGRNTILQPVLRAVWILRSSHFLCGRVFA